MAGCRCAISTIRRRLSAWTTSLSTKVAERSCGHSGDGRPGGHVLGENRPRADHRAFSHPDATENDRTRAKGDAAFDDTGQQLPVLLPLQFTVGPGRARVLVVDEHDAVPDEHLVSDRDTCADEAVALDFAA